QALADMRGAKSATALPLQGGHRLAIFCPPTHQVEGLQVRIHVEGEPVIGHPVVNGNADARYGPASHPNAGTVAPGLSSDVKIPQQSLDHRSESIDIRLQAKAETIERQDGIESQLAWNMQQAAASAIHPADPPAPGSKLLGGKMQVVPASLSTNGDERW